jgi:peptidoglycan/xylan/chitin deacetylase (PgdA/CDA1 family)
MKSRLIVFLAACLLAGCAGLTPAAPMPSPAPPTAIPASDTPTVASTDTATPTITATYTPPPTPTPTWVVQGPGAVNVPILMYHHVEVAPVESPYRVAASKFEDEIRLLHDWQYTPITTTMLIQAIKHGAALPPHPVIITFDDANEDNYAVAFPIMKKYGFTGILYLPFDYIGTPGYLNVKEINEMIAAGWEIGSHTLTHPVDFLTLGKDALRAEIVDSRSRLEELFGVPVLTFAYPFGDVTSAAVDYVHFAGYEAAMGATGYSWGQGKGNLFTLQRCEIRGSEDARTFTRFLPWLGDPSFLPTGAPGPTATPSRTPTASATP